MELTSSFCDKEKRFASRWSGSVMRTKNTPRPRAPAPQALVEQAQIRSKRAIPIAIRAARINLRMAATRMTRNENELGNIRFAIGEIDQAYRSAPDLSPCWGKTLFSSATMACD
jgi:hypothetical protein